LYYERLSLLTVAPLVLWAELDALAGTFSEVRSYVPARGYISFPKLEKPISVEKILELSVRAEMAKRGDPRFVSHERVLKAMQSLYIEGDPAGAVIECHTASEIFFNTLLIALAWEEITFHDQPVLSIEEVARWFTLRSTLSTRLHKYFHPRLDGCWDPAAEKCPLYDWTQSVAVLRNKTVHGGYRPTENEARRALQVFESVQAWTFDLLCRDQNRGAYPRTALVVMGKPGLEKRGVFTKKMRRLHNGSGPEELARALAQFRVDLDARIAESDSRG
jgi:hypothetical protein